jgi:hypothetical protein
MIIAFVLFRIPDTFYLNFASETTARQGQHV